MKIINNKYKIEISKNVIQDTCFIERNKESHFSKYSSIYID